MNNKLITILGPTAVGKTRFAVQLANKFNGEIISADSRQVYIGMDIGTGKDLNDYYIDGKKINYHLIDVVKPHCEFNLYLFTQLFNSAYKEIIGNSKIPFLVGGTALYLNSILSKYKLSKVDFNSPRFAVLEEKSEDELKEILLDINPKQHNITDLVDKERIIKAIIIAEQSESEGNTLELEHLVIGINEDREIVKKRIRERLKKRLQEGMIEEAKTLLNSGVSHEKLRFFGLEYKFLSMYLKSELNYNDMYQKLASAIIQFSKRQMTWYRKMEREGVKINWLNSQQISYAEQLVEEFLS